jgi:glycosyltransferase involved in cell wall biosynthesis
VNEITLCITAKNEEASIHLPIDSVKDYVHEIIVVDDMSTDRTASIASGLGAEIIKYDIPVCDIGFAKAANRTISNATKDWILILDADEILAEPHLLHNLIRYQDTQVWALPRRKWYDYSADKRIEYESYPDWQPKFFRNLPENKFEGEMHIRFIGSTPRKAYRGPHIDHLQLDYRTKEKYSHRSDLYGRLADIQGVNVHGGDLKI